MDQHSGHAEILANQCRLCHSMSAWDLLQDFYKRVEAAQQHSQRLDYDLYRATEHFKSSLAELQRNLAATQGQVDTERLEHTATREELEFERQRHRETEKLLDLTYNAIMESSSMIDSLRARVIELQENPTSPRPVPKTEVSIRQTQFPQDHLKLFKDRRSANNNVNTPDQTSSSKGP